MIVNSLAKTVDKSGEKFYYVAKMATIDPIDEKLIKLLQFDARQSSEVLAKQLIVSPTTVRSRIRKLLANGTIRIVAVTDPRMWGPYLFAFLAINVEINELDSVVEALSNLKEVVNILITTGRFDIMTLVRTASVEDLSHFMRNDVAKIKGIKSIEIMIYMEGIKTKEHIKLLRKVA